MKIASIGIALFASMRMAFAVEDPFEDVFTGEALKPKIAEVRATLEKAKKTKGVPLKTAAGQTIPWDDITSVDPRGIKVMNRDGIRKVGMAEFDEETRAAFACRPNLVEPVDGVENARRITCNLAEKTESTRRRVFEELKKKAADESKGSSFTGKVMQHLAGSSYLAVDEDNTIVRLDLLPGSPDRADGDRINVRVEVTGELYEYETVRNSKKRVRVFREAGRRREIWRTYEEFIQELQGGRMEQMVLSERTPCSYCTNGWVASRTADDVVRCTRCKGTAYSAYIVLWQSTDAESKK